MSGGPGPPQASPEMGHGGGSPGTEGVGFLRAVPEHRCTRFAHLTPPKAATLWLGGDTGRRQGASQPQNPDRCCQQARRQPAGSPGGARVTRDTDTARHGPEMAVRGADPGPHGNEEVQCGRGRPPSRLPETTGITFGLSDEQRPLCRASFWHALVVKTRAVSWGGGHSGILLFIADQLALIGAGVPLTQEVLADGLQLRELQPHLLQVVGAPVPDLTQGERVQVPEGDTDQLPGGTEDGDRGQQGRTWDGAWGTCVSWRPAPLMQRLRGWP